MPRSRIGFDAAFFAALERLCDLLLARAGDSFPGQGMPGGLAALLAGLFPEGGRPRSLPAGLLERVLAETRQALAPWLDRRWSTATGLLNLAGAGLYNRAAREAFHATELRVVIVPERLVVPAAGPCRASRNSLGRSCRGCTLGCPARVAAEVCRGHETLQVLAGDAGELLATWTGAAFAAGGIGVVLAARVPELITTGHRALAAGVPALCLPLDGGRAGADESVNPEALAALLAPAPFVRQAVARQAVAVPA